MTVVINFLLSSIVSLDRWFSLQLICINILFIARKTDLRGHLASNCFHCFYWTRMTDLASLGKEIEMKKRGLRIFSLSHARNKTKKTSFFISLPSSKLTTSLISTYKHYAIDIADPSSMQEACHEPRNRPRSLWSHCDSVVTASEREIRRPEVQFLMGTLNFFFVPRSWRDEKKSFSIECLSWKLNWPIWLVRYQDDYFFPIWRYFAYAWTYFN